MLLIFPEFTSPALDVGLTRRHGINLSGSILIAMGFNTLLVGMQRKMNLPMDDWAGIDETSRIP